MKHKRCINCNWYLKTNNSEICRIRAMGEFYIFNHRKAEICNCYLEKENGVKHET